MKMDIFEKSMFSKSDIALINANGFKDLEKLNKEELENLFNKLQAEIDHVGEETPEVLAKTFVQNKIVELVEASND